MEASLTNSIKHNRKGRSECEWYIVLVFFVPPGDKAYPNGGSRKELVRNQFIRSVTVRSFSVQSRCVLAAPLLTRLRDNYIARSVRNNITQTVRACENPLLGKI